MIYSDEKLIYTVLDLGFDKNLVKFLTNIEPNNTTPELRNVITSGIAAKTLTSGDLIATFDQQIGAIFSGKKSFDNTVSGYRLGIDDASGFIKFYIGNTTNYLNWDGINLTISGSISASSINIPDTTTTNSFHVDSSGNTWWGATTLGGSTANVLNTGVATFSNITINGTTLAFQSDFGDGSDGDATISGGTTNLTTDKFYNNLTIASTGVLSTKSFRVFVKGTLTINASGDLNNNGGSGGNGGNGIDAFFDFNGRGQGGDAGTAGSAVPVGSLVGGLAGLIGSSGGAGAPGNGSGGSDGVNTGNGSNSAKSLSFSGVSGGSGGSGASGGAFSGGSGGSAGTGGSVTGTIYNVPKNSTSAYYLFDTQPSSTFALFTNGASSGSSGSGGGGGCVTQAAGKGGGGGGGGSGGTGAPGGIVWIAARNIVNNGTIRALGGNGGNGGTGSNAAAPSSPGGGGGGGGSGGSGGVGGILILTYSSYSGSGTKTVTGGTGGSGASGGTGQGGGGNGNSGSAGTAGNTGTIIQIIV